MQAPGCMHVYCMRPTVPTSPAGCRLAAQQLGLLSLVPELQEDWARVEAAWATPPARPAAATEDAAEDAARHDQQDDVQLQQQQRAAAAEEAPGAQVAGLPAAAACTRATQQPPFQEAALGAAATCGLAVGGSAGGGAPALPLLAAVDAAPALLAGMSLDEFPRLLAWSDGLCGVTLLPLRCGREGRVGAGAAGS